MNKKYKYGLLATLTLVMVGTSSIGLASMLGISSAAAMKVIDIIDTVSTVATIISLVAVIIGAGVISTAIISTAKSLIKKYGKKYAAAW